MLPVPWPTQSFALKTVIVTGANVGLGLEAARHFVRLGARKVILGCRDLAQGKAAKEDIEASEKHVDGQLEVWEVDLGSFQSVAFFCRRAEHLERLDVVVANAGLLSHVYEQFEGYERQCTVNVISTWLMVLMLLPIMRRTTALYNQVQEKTDLPHMCIVGSNAQFYTTFEQRNEPSIFEALRGGDDMYNRYANTKLMSLLIMREVAQRMRSSDGPQVVLNMVEPGFCKSRLLREGTWQWYYKVMMAVANTTLARTSEMGARNYVWAACAGPESHGIYIEDCMLSTPAPFADTEEGRQLQVRLFYELAGILEGIEPHVMQNIGFTPVIQTKNE